MTHSYKGLDIIFDNVDFVSTNIDTSRAPKRQDCSKWITRNRARRAQGEASACSPCDKPGVLELLQEFGRCEGRRKGRKKGRMKEKGGLHQTSQNGTVVVKLFRDAISSRAERWERSSKDHVEIGEDEALTASKRTQWEENQEERWKRGRMLDPLLGPP